MATIYLVRHGSYNTEHLNQLGADQSKIAGEKIKEDLKGQDFTLYSSPSKRAIETAKFAFEDKEIILKQEFGEWGGFSFEKAMEMLSADEVLVIITHEPIVEKLIYIYSDEKTRVYVEKGDVYKITNTPRDIIKL